MTKQSNFTKFVDALTDELLAMPDEQLLEGVNVSDVDARAQACLQAAKAEAGKRRLAVAKVGVAANKAEHSSTAPSGVLIPVQDARRFIAAVKNDSRYTLAARNLVEMSDDEILRLYCQMMQLREKTDGPDPGEAT